MLLGNTVYPVLDISNSTGALVQAGLDRLSLCFQFTQSLTQLLERHQLATSGMLYHCVADWATRIVLVLAAMLYAPVVTVRPLIAAPEFG